MTFNNGSPTIPLDYLEQGHDITPCKNKVPIVSNWQQRKIGKDEWKKLYTMCNIGLKLGGKTDIDIDNNVVKKFITKYLKSCGAIYGRKSNPRSHYLFLGELKSKIYSMPQELKKYCKEFPHGVTLLEIRSGNGHQSIAPGSSIAGEDVVWNSFANINTYDGDLEADIGKIALSSALQILYPSEGKRDEYCTAIAGVLAKHTEWTETSINGFVYNVAVCSDDQEAEKRMAKGTNAKNPASKNFGMPKISEIVGCTTKTIADLFSWVGVTGSGTSFTGLRGYTTEPKYWQLEYKGKWITVMDSSILLSYTKISILILENCYEVAPVISPNAWKEILTGLLQNVQKINTPYEASYYGIIGIEFVKFFQVGTSEDKTNLASEFLCAPWQNPQDKHFYFRLEHFTQKLKRRQLSFEMRKMTHFLREEFGAEPTKITISKKELRVWKVPEKNIEGHELNNSDGEAWKEQTQKRLDVAAKARADGGLPF